MYYAQICITMENNNDFCAIDVGLDDFDSHTGGCTTHLATYLLNSLASKIKNIMLFDYPNLVRLNPSIPWKTRGNGAVALRILLPCEIAENLESVVEMLEELTDDYMKKMGIEPGSTGIEPGLAVAHHTALNGLAWIYRKAVSDIVFVDQDLYSKLSRRGIVFSKRFNKRGLVGALAAITWILDEGSDYTYELLTYRSRKMYSRDRCIDENSVNLFDELTRGSTFNNYDYDEGRVLIAPHGPDPILYGIRGEDPDTLSIGLHVIKVCEPIAAWTIFRTNQGTDSHAVARTIDSLRPFRTGRIRGVVASTPKILQGGAVLIKVFDPTGEILVAFFKPSKLTEVVSNLDIGDLIEVQGHVKLWNGLQVFHGEKIVLLRISRKVHCKAPPCPQCGRRMKRKGIGKGYECDHCNITIFNPILDCMTEIRALRHALYLPPPHVQKHLVKPVERYGREHYLWRFTPIPVASATQIIEPLEFL